MKRTTLLVVGVVLTAALAGAAGPALAQSNDELVTLTLDVVNPSTNQRLGGVTLAVTWDGGGETQVTTASNGMALVDVPEAASVEITPDDAQYTRNEPYRIRVATEREHTIEVFRKADLDVVVSDGEGRVENARVALLQDGIEVVSGRTDANGAYQSGTVAQGRYTLAVVKAGYYRTTEEVIVAGSPEESVRIERGRVDYDVVVEDPHFDPAQGVSNATVSIPGVGSVVTDSRGAAAPLLPVNSDFEVTVSKEGYGTATETVSTNESRGTLTFELSREPSLSLTALNQRVVVGEVVPVEVTNAYGEPASGAAILVDGEQVARTGADGRATVRIDSGGERELRARQGSTTSEPVTVDGIGEGGEQAQETAAEETTATASPASDSGPSSPGLLPIVAIVVLFVLVVAAILYWRRQSTTAGNPWADEEDEGTDVTNEGTDEGTDVTNESEDEGTDVTNESEDERS